MALDIFKIALLQLNVEKDRENNLNNARVNITKAKQGGAQLVVLPECFNSPYGTKFFDEYAEEIPNGLTSQMLSKAAKENAVFIVGGTIPEKDCGKLYNSCTVWNSCGELIGKYRKMHLFDIDIPGGITFKESEVLSAGNELVTFSMNNIKIGLGICYDLRFEELAKLYRLMNCDMLIYPGAFNMTTGPIHWELLQKSRALDNQLFVVTVSPARSNKGYIAWGHSQVTNPWGKLIAQAGFNEEILFCDINMKDRDEVRQQIPIFLQRRTDIYNTMLTKN